MKLQPVSLFKLRCFDYQDCHSVVVVKNVAKEDDVTA